MIERKCVNDFLSENIMPLLRNIDDFAEGMHDALPSGIEEKVYLDLIRDNIAEIKEIIGVYR